jgi:hypothetical protein
MLATEDTLTPYPVGMVLALVMAAIVATMNLSPNAPSNRVTIPKENTAMTKKHIIALADAIKNGTDLITLTQPQVEALADFCASQNPRFDRERWLGYIAGTNGKNGGKV